MKLAAAVTIVTLGCASAPRGVETASPSAMLDRAIERAGGAAALAEARALIWDGSAVVQAGGRTVSIAGRWSVMPPDSAVAATWDATRGPSTTRMLIVAAPRGWMVRNGQWMPMPAAVLANERDAFYLYDVMRLVPLRDDGVVLAPIAPDSLGQPGFRVRRPYRPDVDAYFDATGRLAHLRATVTDAATGQPVVEDLWLEGEIFAGGVNWPRRIRITLAGAPYFDLSLSTLRVAPHLTDTLFAGPR